MIYKTVRLLLLLLFVGITACTSATDSPLLYNENQLPTTTAVLDNTIYFPHQEKTNGEWAAMEALTTGTLVMKDNCIRLERGESLANYMLIWPPDFSIKLEDDTFLFVNGDGAIVASLGDRVEVSGGEIHLRSLLDESIQEQIPPQCPGPFWLMGYELTPEKP